MRNVLLLVGY